MNFLFVGDIVGQPGRQSLAHWLPKLVPEFSIDIIVVNAENAAGGLGVTPDIVAELHELGVHAITLGNHTWKKKELIPVLDKLPSVVRPANYPDGVPGKGSTIVALPDGRKLGVVSVMGRVYMEPFACPFETALREVRHLRDTTPLVMVDVHAEATSEKIAMGWFLDGQCTAVVGTHTHVQTADERVLPKGTAYITDVGMTGPFDSVIGTEIERALRKFLTGMPSEFKVAKENAGICAAAIVADDTTGRAKSITRIMRFDREL
jgi:metallophosphoesterase (TIGR00282 family)